MTTPPSLPAAPPVAATPVTPVAAPAAIASAPGGATRVLFSAGAADLPDSAKPELDALVQRLGSNDEARLQLVAHASGSGDQANEARRISLQRALAVRSYLIEHGIASTRMDVRALGNRSDGAAGDPLDRVDVIMLEH
jgi:outer membrane protein OmpA-like peptidoglycan-associated protein